MLTQNHQINVVIKTIEPLKYITTASGEEFAIQRFVAVQHGPYMYKSRPLLFQMQPKQNHELLRYAEGDNVRLFFILDGSYLKVHKIERTNPPPHYGNKREHTYEPDATNNLPK